MASLQGDQYLTPDHVPVVSLSKTTASPTALGADSAYRGYWLALSEMPIEGAGQEIERFSIGDDGTTRHFNMVNLSKRSS